MLTYKEWKEEYADFAGEVVPVPASKFIDLINRNSNLEFSCTTIGEDGTQEFYLHRDNSSGFVSASNALIFIWVDHASRDIIYETKRCMSVKRMVVGNDPQFDTIIELLNTKCGQSQDPPSELDDNVDGLDFSLS